MSRIEPQVKPGAAFFLIAKDILSLCMKGFKVVVDPANAAAWVKAVLAVKETVSDSAFLAKQIAEDQEGKMYVSAYAIPATNFDCYANNSTKECQPTTSAQDDAADAGWQYAFAGYPQGELVVLTQVLRGHKAVAPFNEDGSLGDVPVVMVTVMRATDYMTYKAEVVFPELTSGGRLGHVQLSPDVRANVEQLQRLLDKHEPGGVDALRVVVEALDLDNREVLGGVLKSLMTGDSLTNAERQTLHRLVVDLRHALNEEGKR